MKKITIWCCLICSLACPKISYAQLEQILQAHYMATGQQQLATVERVKASGKIVQMGLEIPFLYYQARPHMMRSEGSYMGQTFVQIFNGDEGWNINPFSGNPLPVPMAAAEIEDNKMTAEIDGMLWNYSAKGYTVSLEGNEIMEGVPVYKIQLMTGDSDIYHLYIDTASNMLIRTNTRTIVQGVLTESDSYMSNYIFVDGIAFPGRIENKYGGQTALVIVIDKYELNVPFDMTIFADPTKK